ncbi:hypothetical protein N0V95_001875 [Ascochyta clinopodiicola]|nr:hypothetical protein N0V95_001875 [Ascochyta clinopodiicola]
MSLITFPPNCYHLVMRQQPREALVVAKGKEKARKAVDAPPIIELLVKNSVDPQRNFLQNPYLFMVVSLYKADRDESLPGNESLSGTLSSSLHRLKDQGNTDVGFFVFGDISVKMLGTYRLHFRLYEFSMDRHEAQYLMSITSDKFSVLAPKDFKGMEESSGLSRNIADQGVRLRLRKEARAAASNKRSYPYDSPIGISPARPNMPNDYSSSYEGDHSPVKRDSAYNPAGHSDVSVHPSMEQSYGAQPPYKRAFPSYPSVGQPASVAAPYNMMSPASLIGHHSNLVSPPGVLPSNSSAAYPVDNLSMYGSSAYPNAGSTHQSAGAPYHGANYSSMFYGYDNNIQR